MNRNPKAGDVVRLFDKRAEWLVTNSGRDEVITAEGQAGHCTWFDAVPAKAADPVTGGIDAKKEKRYYTKAFPEQTKNFPFVPLDQLYLTATAKFAVRKQYVVTKLKDVA